MGLPRRQWGHAAFVGRNRGHAYRCLSRHLRPVRQTDRPRPRRGRPVRLVIPSDRPVGPPGPPGIGHAEGDLGNQPDPAPAADTANHAGMVKPRTIPSLDTVRGLSSSMPGSTIYPNTGQLPERAASMRRAAGVACPPGGWVGVVGAFGGDLDCPPRLIRLCPLGAAAGEAPHRPSRTFGAGPAPNQCPRCETSSGTRNL